VLFDGTCKLCNSSASFIMKHDSRGRFSFASSQSPAGSALAGRFGFTGPTPGSIILIVGDHCYSRSTASLQIAKRLDGLWPLLYAFIVIPRPVRDAVYKFIAARRRKWFGTAEQCVFIPASRQVEQKAPPVESKS
jgi:predicted DCC family thiol-disulfide oxidoreductase YuxK